MKEFVSGRRRKVGMVTLLMALVAMTGWVRSQFYVDLIIIPRSASTRVSCYSANQSLIWFRQEFYYPHRAGFQWGSAPITRDLTRFDDGINYKWSFRFWGFHLAESEPIDVLFQRIAFVIIPYWSLACPLTFISIWLLHSHPRASKPIDLPESTHSDGA